MRTTEIIPTLKALIEADEENYFDAFKNSDDDVLLSDDLLPYDKTLDEEVETALADRGVAIFAWIEEGENVGEVGDVYEKHQVVIGIWENVKVNRKPGSGSGKDALSISQRIKLRTSEIEYENSEGYPIEMIGDRKGDPDKGVLAYYIEYIATTNEL